MSMIDHEDRVRALDNFANATQDHLPSAPANIFSAPAERVFGAQPVAVKRNEEDILKKIRIVAAAAGEDFYYRIPVKKKIKNEQGKDEWVTDYIEGPSIKCANAVSRMFGNCDIDTRVMDTGSHWVFYARFMDLETGYCLTRPFQQRKSQGSIRGDTGRQEDIAFQIGASKAIRNVVCNALEFFTSFAAAEAKRSIVEKVGLKIDFYKQKIVERLQEMEIDLKRVEHVRGRAIKDWLATDVAKTIAELQAINDGMSTANESFPKLETVDPATGEVKDGAALNEFAKTGDKTGEHKTGEQPAEEKSASEAQPATSGPASPPSAGPDNAGVETGSASPAPAPAGPANEAEYKSYATAWIAEQTNGEEIQSRWVREKKLRADCGVTDDVFNELEALKKAKVAELKKAKA